LIEVAGEVAQGGVMKVKYTVEKKNYGMQVEFISVYKLKV